MREYIEAHEGYILTDGQIYGKRIYLADGMDKTAFWEIPETEYEDVQAQEGFV